MGYDKIEITNIEYCPSRINNPYMVEVTFKQNGVTDTKWFDYIEKGKLPNGKRVVDIIPNGKDNKLVDFVRREFSKARKKFKIKKV